MNPPACPLRVAGPRVLSRSSGCPKRYLSLPPKALPIHLPDSHRPRWWFWDTHSLAVPASDLSIIPTAHASAISRSVLRPSRSLRLAHSFILSALQPSPFSQLRIPSKPASLHIIVDILFCDSSCCRSQGSPGLVVLSSSYSLIYNPPGNLLGPSGAAREGLLTALGIPYPLHVHTIIDINTSALEKKTWTVRLQHSRKQLLLTQRHFWCCSLVRLFKRHESCVTW